MAVIPTRDHWTRTNTVLTLCSALTLVGAIEVFLFGVLWTRGVYGSRMAWLLGVALPLLAIAGCLGWTAAKFGLPGGRGDADGGGHRRDPMRPHGGRDPRSAPRAVARTSLVLISIPVVLVGLLLVTYGMLFVTHWFH